MGGIAGLLVTSHNIFGAANTLWKHLLSRLFRELTAVQLEFKEAAVAFEAEKAEEGTEESASKIKLEVVSIINEKIVIYLRAMIQVDEPTYGELTRTTAQIIEDNNVIVKKRRAKPEPIVNN